MTPTLFLPLLLAVLPVAGTALPIDTLAPRGAHGTSPAPEAPLRRRAHWGAVIAAPAAEPWATVRSVEAGGAAARAGLAAGDRIVALGGARVDSDRAWWPRFRAIRGGDSARVRLVRGGERGDTLELLVVPDSLPWERIPGKAVEYGVLRSDRGARLRSIVARPAERGGRHPAVLFVQWLSCSSVEAPLDASRGFDGFLRQLSGVSGLVVARVEKPGVGDSEGPDCTVGTLEDELAGYRAALRALRAREDVDPARLLIVGGSIGGGLAPVLAAEQPAGLRGVVAINGFHKTWYEHMLELERRRLAFEGTASRDVHRAMAAYARLYTATLIDGLPVETLLARDPALRPWWYHGTWGLYGRPLAYYRQVQALDVEGAWTVLASRGVPGLVVWGEYDWIMSRSDQELAVARLREGHPSLGELIVHAQGSHLMERQPTPMAAYRGAAGRYDEELGARIIAWIGERLR